MSKEFVTVYTAMDPIDAELIKTILDAEGIPCILDSSNHAFSGCIPVHVQVNASDAERAQAFIAAHEPGKNDAS